MTTATLFASNVISTIRHLFRARTSPHTWNFKMVDEDEHRTCSTCGRVEVADIGDGVVGTAWLPRVKGTPSAHKLP